MAARHGANRPQGGLRLPRVLDAALLRFQTTSNVQSANEAVSAACTSESERLDSELSMIRYVTWAIPSIGFIGTVLGLFFGLIVASNIDVIVPAIEGLFGVQFLAKDVYYISDIPSEIQLDDVIWIGLLSLGLTMLATIYPSLRAAKVNPSEALRYE